MAKIMQRQLISIKTIFRANRPIASKQNVHYDLEEFKAVPKVVSRSSYFTSTTINQAFKDKNYQYENDTIPTNFCSLNDLYEEWLQNFKDNQITDPEISIRYIIQHVMDFNEDHNFKTLLRNGATEEQVNKIKTLCECRLARMPVQYVIKEWDFRELRLAMVPPVFIPRPETEQLVDLVLKTVSADSRVLEVGCGSGAISLSLLHSLPQACVMAVDQSKLACQLTKKNAELNSLTNNLTVVTAKLLEDGKFSEPVPVSTVDVIVSNPPYVPSVLLPTLQPEITLYEDLRALDGGRDGLKVVKALLLLARDLLRSDGNLFLEVDPTHPALILKWLSLHPELNLTLVQTHRDFCDRDRFVHLKKL